MSEETRDTRVCTMCLLCLREDYGYSNYTTEGTELECLAGLNPEMSGREEEQWNEAMMAELAPILDKAKSCPRYREGAPASLDVDREGIPWDDAKRKVLTPADLIAAGYTDDAEAAALLLAYLLPTEPR